MDNVSGAAYLYEKTTVNSNSGAGVVNVTGNDYLYVAGLKAKVMAGPAWLKAEIAKDFGSNRTVNAAGNYTATANYTGWAGKADAGVKIDLSTLGALTGWGEFGIGSGGGTTNRNCTAIAGDYRPGSIWGRFGGTAVGGSFAGGLNAGNTLSNLVVAGAGVKVTPAALSKLTAGISVWNFRRQTANGVGTANAGNKNLGNEYDLDLTWAHSENVSLSVGAGDFQPNRGLTIAAGAANAGNVSPARLGYADLSVKF
jgi:hypothetical protein